MTTPLDAVFYELKLAGPPLLHHVTFAIADPADEHEAAVRLRWSRASWESQGSPRRLTMELTVPEESG